MAAPVGGEITIYDATTKDVDFRLMVSLKYPALLGAMVDTFDSSPMSAYDYWHTDLSGPPLIEGSLCKLRMFGGASHEMFETRPHWFPTDNRAFTIETSVGFPLDDPLYNVFFRVGGVDNYLGIDYDCLQVAQVGSLHSQPSGSDIGYLMIGVPGQQANGQFGQPNDKQLHTYTVAYDPNDPIGIIKVSVDGVIIYHDDGPRPTYVSYGFMNQTESFTRLDEFGATVNFVKVARETRLLTPADPADYLLGGGTIEVPIPIIYMNVNSLSITAPVYETITYPDWSNGVDLGATIDTAPDGQVFTMDSEKFAKIPKTNIESIKVSRGRAQDAASDTMGVEIKVADPTDPDNYQNLFLDHRLIGRIIILDTRVSNGTSYTAWKRQFVGVIEQVTTDGITLSITSRDRPSTRLDTFLSRGYTDIPANQARQSGVLSGVMTGLSLSAILENIVAVSDAVAGGILGNTDTHIVDMESIPRSLSTGSQSLLSSFQEFIDRTAHEWWRKYAVTGDGKYGMHVVNAYRIDGTPEYIFRGLGETNDNILMGGVKLTEGRLQGPGQILYRDDAPSSISSLFTIFGIPLVGVFPGASWPPTDLTVNDSYGLIGGSAAFSPTAPLRRYDNSYYYGGIAPHRYRMENMMRRVIEFTVEGHDWLEPSDCIAVSDELRTGLAEDEPFIVDNLSIVIQGGHMKTTIQASTTDWEKAIRRTL